MKKLSFLVGLFLVALAARAQNDPPSTHGMFVFGREKLFFHHLPMFHVPHQYQVVFEMQLHPQTQAVWDAERLAQPNQKFYTFDPETFVLPERVQSLAAFGGTLVRGHFERPGNLRLLEFDATQNPPRRERPLKAHVFKVLNGREARPTDYEAFLVGTVNDVYLVHHITARPNFDQISRVTMSELPQNFNFQSGMKVRLANRSDLEPLVANPTVHRATTMGDNPVEVGLRVEEVLYLEINELR